MDGRAVYTNSNKQSSSVVQAVGDSTQILTVIEGSSAPSAYTFGFDLKPGTELIEGTDGAILIAQGDLIVGEIAAPWAVDANGRQVPTSYEIVGSSITQKVNHTGAAYPVVADPSVSFGVFVYVKFNRSETSSIAGIADYGSLVSAACGLIPVPGASVACAVIVGAAAIQLGNNFKNAAASGRCVEMRFNYIPPLIGGYVGSSIVNC